MQHHYHQHQYTMRRWVKLENCQCVFKEENILEWLSKFGKPLTCWKKKPTNLKVMMKIPKCSWKWKFECKNDNPQGYSSFLANNGSKGTSLKQMNH